MTQNQSGARAPLLRRLTLALALSGAFVSGGLVLSGAPASALGQAMHHGGMGHGASHAEMQAHVDKMLTEVGADAGQKAKITQILQNAFHTMPPVHQRMDETHAQLHALLTAPAIDRAALEQLRAQRMAEADQASRVLVTALADSAEVLRPDQRAKLAALMAEHHGPS